MIQSHMVSFSTYLAPQVQKVVVSSESVGQRVDNFLFTYLRGVPKTRVYRIIRKGEVRVNQGRVKPTYKLMLGDLLRIPPVRQGEVPSLITLPSNSKMAEKLLTQVLFEDEGLIVLNKPAGMAVHGGSGVSFGVIEALRYLKGHTLELVHRLDRETSGCLMIAKRRSVLRAIHEQLRIGEVEKIYWALVKGEWKGGNKVSAPLQKNQLLSGERIVKVFPNGQQALTEFRVLKQYPALTLVEAKPKTGRTHQIRVHTSFVGNPIVGDPKYGDACFNQEMKRKGINRLFLHAQKISLKLPLYERTITVEAPLEQTLQESLMLLGG